MKKVEELKKEAKESAKNKNRVRKIESYLFLFFHLQLFYLKIVMETIKENPLYVYKPTIFKHHGPSFPGFDDILKKYVAFKIYFFFLNIEI